MPPSPDAAIPARPRLSPLAPVLVRGRGEVQVGDGPGRGLVLRGVPAYALELLDGRHTLAEVAEESGLGAADADWLVRRLDRAGLLEGESASGPPVVLRLVGAGTLALPLAESWLQSGLGEIVVIAPEPPPPGLYAEARGSAAATLCAHLRARGLGRARRAEPRTLTDPGATITVVATDTLEADRAVTDELVRADLPHLLIRPSGAGVVVGPLVEPGITCCVRCTDLVRCRDPAWPTVLAQLCRTERRTPPGPARWAAETAVLQVRSWLAGRRPTALSATLEIDAPHWTLTTRSWPRHPDCGCVGLDADDDTKSAGSGAWADG